MKNLVSSKQGENSGNSNYEVAKPVGDVVGSIQYLGVRASSNISIQSSNCMSGPLGSFNTSPNGMKIHLSHPPIKKLDKVQSVSGQAAKDNKDKKVSVITKRHNEFVNLRNIFYN